VKKPPNPNLARNYSLNKSISNDNNLMNDFSYVHNRDSPQSRNFSKLDKNEKGMLLPMSSKSIIQVKTYTTAGRKSNSRSKFNDFTNKSRITIPENERDEREVDIIPAITSITSTSFYSKKIEPENMNTRQDLGKIDLTEIYNVEIKKHLISKIFYPPGYIHNVKKPSQTNETNENQTRNNYYRDFYYKENNHNKPPIPNKIKEYKNKENNIKERDKEDEFSEESYIKEEKKLSNDSSREKKNNNFYINKQEGIEYDKNLSAVTSANVKDKKHKEMEVRIKGIYLV